MEMGEGRLSMKRKKHTPEQVVKKLREADTMVGQGASVAETIKALGVSEQTYYRWKRQYGGVGSPEIKRLRELERENARLKRIVAEQALDLQISKEIIEGKY